MNIWEGEEKKKGRGKQAVTLNNREQTGPMEAGQWGMRWARWGMGFKEGMRAEHRVLYGSDESLNSIPKTNIALYIH